MDHPVPEERYLEYQYKKTYQMNLLWLMDPPHAEWQFYIATDI